MGAVSGFAMCSDRTTRTAEAHSRSHDRAPVAARTRHRCKARQRRRGRAACMESAPGDDIIEAYRCTTLVKYPGVECGDGRHFLGLVLLRHGVEEDWGAGLKAVAVVPATRPRSRARVGWCAWSGTGVECCGSPCPGPCPRARAHVRGCLACTGAAEQAAVHWCCHGWKHRGDSAAAVSGETARSAPLAMQKARSRARRAGR